jgi:hypothetical protein
LYDNAVDTIRRNIIGDIHHIRAQWHRGNLPGNDSWQPPLPTEALSAEEMKKLERAAKEQGGEKAVKELQRQYKLVKELHDWEKKRKEATASEQPAWIRRSPKSKRNLPITA